jgi:hypothetical protein
VAAQPSFPDPSKYPVENDVARREAEEGTAKEARGIARSAETKAFMVKLFDRAERLRD